MTGDARARKDGLKARARVADLSLVMPEQNRPKKTLVLHYNKNCFQERAQFPRPTVTEWQVEQATEQHT